MEKSISFCVNTCCFVKDTSTHVFVAAGSSWFALLRFSLWEASKMKALASPDCIRVPCNEAALWNLSCAAFVKSEDNGISPAEPKMPRLLASSERVSWMDSGESKPAYASPSNVGLRPKILRNCCVTSASSEPSHTNDLRLIATPYVRRRSTGSPSSWRCDMQPSKPKSWTNH